MPANKKKKKPANPARGFATISTASKTKSSGIDDAAVDTTTRRSSEEQDSLKEQAATSDEKPRNEVERPLDELSPDELEKQLEESSLQLILDNSASQVSKSVARQVSRLQTERRILRNQAMPLRTLQWLPEEMMQLIADQLCMQQSTISIKDRKSEPGPEDEAISGDDQITKLWTLRQVLLQLGFSLELTQSALRHILQVKETLDAKDISKSKDMIWGLEECLSWLSVTAGPKDLPSFVTQSATNTPCMDRDAEDVEDFVTIGEAEGSGTEANTSTASELTTPPQEIDSASSQEPPNESREPSSQSESDSDIEPEHLVEKYIAAHKRLHEISPDLVGTETKAQKKSQKSISLVAAAHLDRMTKRKVDRLTAKINRIKADVLFDKAAADHEWALIHTNLIQEAAERRRLNVGQMTGNSKQTKKDVTLSETESLGNDDGVENIMGDLFLGDSAAVTDSNSDSPSPLNEAKTNITIRNFGKWIGANPRKVFEEMCKSRDASSRITYKLISESSFSRRHSLEVKWSRKSELIVPIPIDAVFCKSSPRAFKIEMVSVACPDSKQSESYVSTIALFLLFSSKSEQKASMRLPSVWRNLWDELSALRREVENEKDRNVLREIRNLVEESEKHGVQLMDIDADHPTQSAASTRQIPEQTEPRSQKPIVLLPEEIRSLWLAKERMPSYQKMLPGRTKLPIHAFKNDLLSAIADHQVIIICGETGCVPAYIIEHELSNGRSCKIYCTEPRRISAISLARRVSEELGERKGDIGTPQSLIGYAIRLENRISPQTRLVYATTGIVMRMLEGGDELGEITHLLLDEVHERSIDSDFLLIALRKLLARRHDLKVILMSATVNAQRFSDYLNQAPIFNVPGRTFPVETKFLEDAIEETHFNSVASENARREGNSDDYDDDDDVLLADDGSAKTSLSADSLKKYSARTCNSLLKYNEYRINFDLILKLLVTIASKKSYSTYSKAILVFLPGIAEIRKLHSALLSHSSFQDHWDIHALHSSIAMEEQERAFLVPPKGIRKIVLATNIAETGITIPDVTCVIDTGKHREMRFDERRQLSRLIEVFVSRANAKQRRGRAGRVQKGLCFHMFTKSRHDDLMLEEQVPEMLRLSLQDLVLRVKICKLGGIEQILGEALDPPSSRNIKRATDALIDVRALTTSEDLTPLGRRLAKLPLDVFLGKLVLLGAIFSCLDAMLTIAAIISSKSPFSAAVGARSQMENARLAFKKSDSDPLTVYTAYCAWRRICCTNGVSEYQFCKKNFLNSQTLSSIEDLKAQLTTSVLDAGSISLDLSEKALLQRIHFNTRKRNFVELPPRYNKYNDNQLVLNSVIAWSFYPKLLRREGKHWKNIVNNQVVSLHPTSVNKGPDCTSQWLSFYNIMQSSNKFYNAHETTSAEDIAIALVCGEADFRMYSGVVVIDGNRIRFSFEDWKTMSAIKALRYEIRQIMALSFRSPERPLTQQQQTWLDIWERIFTRHNGSKS
ncbi:hypothetical protein ACLMJK_009535 [Lecanora helva]